MENVTTIGLDIAKSVFQVHGVNVDGEAALSTIGSSFAARSPVYCTGRRRGLARLLAQWPAA